MLSREVCKQCVDSRSGVAGGGAWCPFDDEIWDSGFVLCPIGSDHMRSVLADPPTYCTRFFEHAVCLGMSDVK